MANAYYYSNIAQQTTLSGSISSSATAVQVQATSGFPPSVPYVLALDYGAATEELILVTAAGGTTLTATRGFGGTSAQSHSIGAVVRHVVNAQDLTDFRTHEAATASVHGVTGDLVGTAQVQTLTNKTLTAPTINGGALSGTFTGSPTFSGAVALTGGGALGGTFAGSPTFSGAISTQGLLSSVRPTAADGAYVARAAGDTYDRWYVRSDGRMSWGPGSGNVDAFLYRDGVNALKTDGSLAAASLSSGSLSVTGTGTIATLNVTSLTPGSVTVPAGDLLTAATGWAVNAASEGVLKAGFMTVSMNFNRTGAAITANGVGALSTGATQMATFKSPYGPDAGLGTMYTHAGNTTGTGTGFLTAGTGAVTLVRWQANQTISTGDIIAMTVTYPL